MTDFSGSSPSSPNTKPEPRYHQRCCQTNSGLSGSSCALVLLPMPDSKQRCGKYVVKSFKNLWNSHIRHLNAFYRMLSYFLWYLILAYHAVSNERKRTSSNSLRSAWWTRHISAQIICVVFFFLSLTSPLFHRRLALSGSILSYLSAHDRFLSILTILTKTKPQPRYHQCCFFANPGLSGPSSASVPLPMPDSKQRCAKYVVKSSKILWNSHTHKKSQRLLPHAFILPLILTYHMVSNEMKRTSSNSLRSAWWTWHISAQIICVVFLSLISPFHLRLALSGSILPYLPSWPVPQDPHHPHQTPSLSPCITNFVALQIQVCQGRVLLQSLCQCLTGNKDVQKYVVKSSKILWNSHTRNLNPFYRMLLILPLILTYHAVSNEMKRTSSNSFRSEW